MSAPFDRLPEASYGEITFPVSALSTDGGNDVAEHSAYLRRGADVEPCGQRAYRGTLSVPCINTPRLVQRYGTLFPDLRNALIKLFEDVPIRTLTHPTLGTFPAAITGWREQLAPEQRSGVVIEVEWVEHDARASLAAAPDSTRTPSSVSDLAADADARSTTLGPPSGYVLVAPIVDAQLTILGASVLSFTAVAACFRVMLDPIAANLALTAFAPASAHAATMALLGLRASVLELRSRYMPTLAAARTYTVPLPMALWEVALTVYGDASRTSLLRAANAIPDPLLVPAGTVLTVLPLDGAA